jgi:hypothetical protein
MSCSSTSTSSSSAAKPSAASTAKKHSASTAAASAASASTAAAAPAVAPVAATTPAASSNPVTTTVSTLKKLPRETFSKPTPAPPNSFQEALERLDDEKQISYLMLGASEVLPDFNVKRTHPYSYFFFKKKGYKQTFQPNKNIIVQEIKRRQPEAKPNQNNRSNDDLMEMLRERWPLVEPDKEYIVQKEKDYRKLLTSVLNPREVIQLDELTDLAASPTGAAEAMSINNSSRNKRSIGEMDLVSTTTSPARGSRTSTSTLGNVVAGSYYGSTHNSSSSKRRSNMSSTNDNGHSSSALETMLIQAANACADKLSYANLANTIERLKKERFDLNMKKLPLVSKHTPGNVQSIAFMDNRIKEITDSIFVYEAKMGILISSVDV